MRQFRQRQGRRAVRARQRHRGRLASPSKTEPHPSLWLFASLACLQVEEALALWHGLPAAEAKESARSQLYGGFRRHRLARTKRWQNEGAGFGWAPEPAPVGMVLPRFVRVRRCRPRLSPVYPARLLNEACQTRFRCARPEACLAPQGHQGLWGRRVPQGHQGLRGHPALQERQGLRGRHLAWQLRAGRHRIARIFPVQGRSWPRIRGIFLAS